MSTFYINVPLIIVIENIRLTRSFSRDMTCETRVNKLSQRNFGQWRNGTLFPLLQMEATVAENGGVVQQCFTEFLQNINTDVPRRTSTRTCAVLIC